MTAQIKSTGWQPARQVARSGGLKPIESNRWVASRLRDYADLLEQQGASGFREQAYRRAAETVLALSLPVADILHRKGSDGLIALPGVGKGIAGAIVEMMASGHWAQLERLRGETSPEQLFQTIPGIGPELSKRIVDEAQIESLEDLESAMHSPDVRISGIGSRRRQAIAAVLAERLGRSKMDRTQSGLGRPASQLIGEPPVSVLLKVDAMYRERAAAGMLRTIAPKRFNPSGRAWLPIMHASHDSWHFTAMFSNTARAHQLARTNDWVVIYFQTDEHAEGRCTVVTETRGPAKGKRVVRGREQEKASSRRHDSNVPDTSEP